MMCLEDYKNMIPRRAYKSCLIDVKRALKDLEKYIECDDPLNIMELSQDAMMYLSAIKTISRRVYLERRSKK